MAQSVQIKSVKAWHEELIDFMLAQPRAGLKETSEFFGVSMSWLSIVKNSDAFQEEWSKRRKLHSSAVSISLVERVEALAEVAVDTMTRKLEREGEAIGLTTLREVSETALKSLGFGARDAIAARSTTINDNRTQMIVVDKETLSRAREARARMQIEGSGVPGLAADSDSTPEQRRDADASDKPKLGEARGPPRDALPTDALLGDLRASAIQDSDRFIAVVDNIPPRNFGGNHGDFLREFGGDRSDESEIDRQDGED